MKKALLIGLKVLLGLILLAFVGDLVAIFLPKQDKDFHLQDFGRLPTLLNGRLQPLDSVGRNALLQIRNTAAVPLEEKKSYEFWKHPKKLRATEWLLEALMKPEVADTRPLFLIHHPDLLNELDLRGKGVEKSGLFYFSLNELTNCMEKIEKEGRQVMGVEAQSRTAYQRQVAALHNALSLYRRIKNSPQPEGCRDLTAEIVRLKQSMPAGIAALRASKAGQDYDKAALERFAGLAGQFEFMSRLAYPLLVPPRLPEEPRTQWRNMGQAIFDVAVSGVAEPPAVGWYARMAAAYRQGDFAAFNQSLAEYRHWLGQNMAPELKKGRNEYFFNNLQSFLHSMIVYVFAFLLAVGAMLTVGFWPAGAEALRRTATWLVVLAFVVHTFGLVFRMYLERRPPVTNLYSSAIFVGWMAVLLGIILERIYRAGIGAATASIIGFITLIIAHNLAVGGDTMEMMRAVLDSNFWLATHVVTISLGYAANFVAGLLGLLYVFLGLATPLLAFQPGAPAKAAAPGPATGQDLGQALAKMVYGIVCFATLFSFVGTVLGGIWADQSWGRFWGWDPKENGALIIVLWNALVLHARWSGMVGERGLMNLAIFGNIVTSFSWFGVNMLGVGLHSYGFMDAAFKWLVLFVVSQALLILVGCLPLRWWWGYRERERAPQPPSSPTNPQNPPGSQPVSVRA
jgi:cytochrome c-type biogenesis protein CcsB